LGNPGRRYRRTRHNVGWGVARELADRIDAGAWKKRRFDAAVAEGFHGGEKIVLARPRTYMNRSGRAVRLLVDFWQVGLDDLLVVVDDLNLDLGRLRLRRSGSDGGHNGLASIIGHLESEDFARLRVGIGPPPPAPRQVDFVLEPFAEEQKPVIAEAVRGAADAALFWAERGIEEAMNRFNAWNPE
jgi:PTH1 family peptidyl-tRNA hydrolase